MEIHQQRELHKKTYQVGCWMFGKRENIMRNRQCQVWEEILNILHQLEKQLVYPQMDKTIHRWINNNPPLEIAQISCKSKKKMPIIMQQINQWALRTHKHTNTRYAHLNIHVHTCTICLTLYQHPSNARHIKQSMEAQGKGTKFYHDDTILL